MDQGLDQNKNDVGEPTPTTEAETPNIAERPEDTTMLDDGPWVEVDSGLSESRRTVRKAFMNQRTHSVGNRLKIGRFQ